MSLLDSSYYTIQPHHRGRTWTIVDTNNGGVVRVGLSSPLVAVCNFPCGVNLICTSISIDGNEMVASKGYLGMCVEFQGSMFWRLLDVFRNHRLVIRVGDCACIGEEFELVLRHAANAQERLCCYEAFDWIVLSQVPRKRIVNGPCIKDDRRDVNKVGQRLP